MEKNLKPGEMICDVCNGTGKVDHDKIPMRVSCKKCYGTGKVDWIENITGKDDVVFPNVLFSTPNPPKRPTENDMFFDAVKNVFYIFKKSKFVPVENLKDIGTNDNKKR